MIDVRTALALVKKYAVPVLGYKEKKVAEALGDCLYEPLVSEMAMPPFRQSSMDGYAVRFHDGSDFRIVGEVKTGDAQDIPMQPGDAVRIFTGAPVPSQADAVVMQEQTLVSGTKLSVQVKPKQSQNIRDVGTQFQPGTALLTAGTPLNGAALGLCSMIGKETVKVHKKPSVALILTGNELIPPGNPLDFGKVYESNSSPIKGLLELMGYPCKACTISDDYQETIAILKKSMDENNVVLISGGISVGDYDFVGKALEDLEVEEVFYKVRQRPGKPLYFGKKGDSLVFALPGNPASTLTCFFIYVYVALQKIAGSNQPGLPRFLLPMANDYTKNQARAEYLKASISEGQVHLLDGQQSSMIWSFSQANALIFLDEGSQNVKQGDSVEVIYLPF